MSNNNNSSNAAGRRYRHHEPKSPSMLDLRQLANGHDFQEDDNNNNNDDSDDDSNPIIWEDDAGTDLRHLFVKKKKGGAQNNKSGNNNSDDDDNSTSMLLPPTMTQQVDELLADCDSSSSSSDGDDDNNNGKRNNNMLHHGGGKENNIQATTAATTTLTPPPSTAAMTSKRLLFDSGEIPATISKLKRPRRHHCQQQKVVIFDTNNSLSAAVADDLSVGGREVGATADDINNNNGNSSRVDNNVDNNDDDDGVENLLKEIELGLDQVCNNNNETSAVAAARGSKSGSYPSQSSTDNVAVENGGGDDNDVKDEKKVGSSSITSTHQQQQQQQQGDGNARHTTTTLTSSVKQQQQQLHHPQPKISMSSNTKSSNEVKSSSNDGGLDTSIYDFDNEEGDEEIEYILGLSGDGLPSSSSQTSSQKTCSSANNNNHSSTPKPPAAPAISSTGSTVVGQQQCPPPPPPLATSTTTLTVTTSSPSSDNNDNNQGAIPAASSFDFLDNDGDDAYLTTIDLSGTQQQQQQQQQLLPQLQCHTINEATSYDDEGAYDFGNDDFDISAIDNQVKQYNESKPTDSDYIPPPPVDAPIHNRQYCDFDGSNSNDVGSTSQKGPLFLSFTRYIIRQVNEDSNTYTKTIHVSISNPKEEVAYEDETERLKKICSNRNDTANHTAANSVDGCIHLRGEWFHTNAQIGDIIHLCSISGKYLTDKSALPVILHSSPPAGSDMNDDLVLVIHPDELITPTLVSEVVKCPRLAVLQSRLGSTGLSAKSAVIGTLRHDLFEMCIRERDTSRKSAALFTRQIIRKNAEALVGCGITSIKEAFSEVIKTLPQIQSFLDEYTSWNLSKKGGQQGTMSSSTVKHGGSLLNGTFPVLDTLLSVDDVFATEEWALVPELGLKGNVDATILGRIKPVQSMSTAQNSQDNVEQDVLLPIELKTGHNQNPQHNHLAQLSVYTIMLRARHGSAFNDGTSSSNNNQAVDLNERGAASSGMLLYLNDKSFQARHVKPSLSDIKTLIGQRNGIVCDVLNAARPRGITLEYEQEDNKRARFVVNDPPASALPPLNPNTSSCERCYKNRECMLVHCADTNAESNAPRSSIPHRRLLDHFTGHLNGTELDYFRKWDRLIDLERHASPSDIAKSWLYDSNEKEAKDGRCISSMLLDETHLPTTLVKTNASGGDETVTVRFRRSVDGKVKQSITNLHFEVGAYVIVRTDEASLSAQKKRPGNSYHARGQRILIFRGTVASVSEESIDILLQQKDISRLRPKDGSKKSKFRIDRDELSNGAGLLLQNLVNFFTLDIPPFSAEAMGQTPLKTKQLTQNTEYATRRRRLTSSIIRLEPAPRFEEDVLEGTLFSEDYSFIDVPGCDRARLKADFQKLNSDQKAAVLKVIAAQDFSMIQGLPGTGKSATIVFITRLLVARGKRILLTSYTHSAVDNLLCKLMDSGVTTSDYYPNPVVRVGRESSTHANVHRLLAQNIACEAECANSSQSSQSFTRPNADYLHNVVSSARVVGVSALTAPRSPLLAGQKFDVVIVDEAGQISQPAILGAIMAADSFVLVGDHMQLPPLVVSEVADQAGYGISMLMHLAEGFPDAVAKLTMQYRMNVDICHFSNLVAYKGLLKCGNETVANQRLRLPIKPKLEMNHNKQWVEKVINPNNPVVFLDCAAKEIVGPINSVEVSIVEECVRSLSACGLNMSSIGVITPFRSQLRALKENPFLLNLMSNNDGLEICTIDRFQGRDKSVVIISLVRSNSEGKSGRLLQDFRRLNVAFSRAKHKMIIIGSYATLHRGSDVLRPVLESCRQRGWIEKVPAVEGSCQQQIQKR